jgi:hypothetical protein
VLTEDGEVAQQRLPNDVAGLEKFFAQLPAHTPVAIETLKGGALRLLRLQQSGESATHWA